MPELSPATLGFREDGAQAWTRGLRGRQVQFRLLSTLEDLIQAERLQEEVFGVTDRDLIPANELIVVAETGGAVIGAFLPQEPEVAAGVLVGWGGFVGKPRIVSDFLAVREPARNLGLAEQLKRLQAAVALQQGFQEIVWTVDPLRAANARLNFGKLGATANHYENDRYGATFAAALYGSMPTDRLHVTWDIASPRVLARLRSQAGTAHPPEAFDAGPRDLSSARTIEIPADIDALLAVDPAAARDWRMLLRVALPQAFADGFAVTGFVPSTTPGSNPALLLTRQE
ncbi:MAG: GNAT family N-acetyltransferase [Thermomicrobiales bacterium]|nr:GNAT family N-acetyltransferase [Thermomicrobiales bacterium]